jgi:hypothetical protein
MVEYPDTWIRGQMLDLKRFSDGTYRASLLGDTAEHPPEVEFDCAQTAQDFVSWWYAKEAARGST